MPDDLRRLFVRGRVGEVMIVDRVGEVKLDDVESKAHKIDVGR
jgi:hypothetical protein